MNRWSLYARFVAMVGVAHLCLTGVAFTSTDHDRAGSHGHSMDAATQAMMAKWQAYASPNDNHRVLDPLVGTWSHVVTWWMTPDSQPEMSKGTTETQWVMGGRFLRSAVSGMAMGPAGTPATVTIFDFFKKSAQNER